MIDKISSTTCAVLLGGLVLIASHIDANSAGVGAIEIKQEQITEKSTEYSVDYSTCRFFVSVDAFSAPNFPERMGLHMGVPMPCREPLSVQMQIFERMLEHVVAVRPDVRKSFGGILPSVAFSEEFIAAIARKAYASKQWKKVVARKKRGDSVNRETLYLLRESSAYGEFINMFARQGIAIELVDVEKAFLITVSDVASRDAKHQDLSDLPKKFLVPGRAIVRVKVVADGK